MSHFSLPISSIPAEDTAASLFINHWLKAIIAFQQSYNQLNQCGPFEPGSPPFGHFVGQCTIGQVDQLIAKMSQELERLVTEMDTPLSRFDLINHTARLNRLTNQAAVLLSLVKLSSC